MNGIQSRNIEENIWQFSFKRVLFQLGLVVWFAFLFFITLMKAKGTAGFGFEPILYTYTIFVTTFQLSRLTAAMFYNHAYRGSVLVKAKNGVAPSEKYEPTVTFIIPCKNEEAVIAETAANCFKVDYPKQKIEVIVINDGSTDGTADAIESIRNKYPNLIFVDWEKNRGKKHAMAEGFRLAQGRNSDSN